MWNLRDDGPPRKHSLHREDLTQDERLFTMEICGVKRHGIPYMPELVIRANRLSAEITAKIFDDKDDGA